MESVESIAQAPEPRRVTRGFFPFVAARDVRVEQGGGVVFFARRNLAIERGGGQWPLSAGNLNVHQGGGAALVARNAWVKDGFVGMLVAWNATLAPGARVLLRVTPAVSLAAAAGFVAGWLCSRTGAHADERAT